jgi:hypothetical protein
VIGKSNRSEIVFPNILDPLQKSQAVGILRVRGNENLDILFGVFLEEI